VTIEVLYIPGCPNYEPTMERVKTVLSSEFLPDRPHSVAVTTDSEAKSLKFPGSPTVRVNGRDIEPSATTQIGLACRVYANGSGVPADHMLRAAILWAKREE